MNLMTDAIWPELREYAPSDALLLKPKEKTILPAVQVHELNAFLAPKLRCKRRRPNGARGAPFVEELCTLQDANCRINHYLPRLDKDWQICQPIGRGSNDKNTAASFVDQSGAQGLRGLLCPAQIEGLRALAVAAEGGKADNVKPLKGFGSGVMEIVLRHRDDAFRVIYALQIGEDVWVVHAFQKKSTQGIKTPRHEIELVHDRIKRLKEMLS